jgi:hypothetical protein
MAEDQAEDRDVVAEQVAERIAARTAFHQVHQERRVLGQVWVNGFVVGNTDPAATDYDPAFRHD